MAGRSNGIIKTVYSPLVECAVLFLIPGAALDEHFGADSADSIASGQVVIGIDEEIIVEVGRIARGIQTDTHVNVLAIGGYINVLVVDGLGRVLWVGERQ